MEVPEAPASLQHLANIIKLSKETGHRPYLLVLTSALSLTPEVRMAICRSESWHIFSEHIRHLSDSERIRTLAAFLRPDHLAPGYRALAHLIQADYFSLVFTANPGAELENALLAEGHAHDALHVFIVDGHNEKSITTFLDDPPRTAGIIKLHGSLKEAALPAGYPEILELPAGIRDAVKRHLNREMLVVGSIEHDHDLARLLPIGGSNSIYYALETEPGPYDDVLKAINARKHKREERLITGRYGQFNRFFETLEVLLIKQDQPRQSPGKAVQPKADVLLITVTEIEAQAVLNLFPRYDRIFIGHKTYYDLGSIAGARICMVQSEMGSGGPGGSLFTVSEGIRALSPSSIVMVGIAFGLDSAKQQIGDILVSQQIFSYEQQRVGSNSDGGLSTLPRGARSFASPRLLDRFKSGVKDWKGQQVKFGLILSGEKLIDHPGFRDQLRVLEPEASGGEMEGAGLCAAAVTHNVDWILVKAICDWADGKKSLNKDENQQRAARNAAQFTFHVLQQGGFTGT